MCYTDPLLGRLDPLLVPPGLDPKILCSEKEAQAAIRQLAEKIEQNYRGQTLYCVVNLQGAIYFYVDLIRAIYRRNIYQLSKLIASDRALEVSELEIRARVERERIHFIEDSITTNKYGHGTDKDGEIRVIKDLKEPVRGQIVLVVDDVYDTGETATFLLNFLRLKGPAQILFCFLFRKDVPNPRILEAKYDIGKLIADKWLVGVGLDGKGPDQKGVVRGGMYRYLPYLTSPLPG